MKSYVQYYDHLLLGLKLVKIDPFLLITTISLDFIALSCEPNYRIRNVLRSMVFANSRLYK